MSSFCTVSVNTQNKLARLQTDSSTTSNPVLITAPPPTAMPFFPCQPPHVQFPATAMPYRYDCCAVCTSTRPSPQPSLPSTHHTAPLTQFHLPPHESAGLPVPIFSKLTAGGRHHKVQILHIAVTQYGKNWQRVVYANKGATAVTGPLLAAVGRQALPFVQNCCTECNNNPTSGLIADTTADRQTDGLTDRLCTQSVSQFVLKKAYSRKVRTAHTI